MITVEEVSTLLQKCRVSLLLSSLIVIACPNTSTFAKLTKYRKVLPRSLMSCCGEEIKTSLIQKNIKRITIAVLGRSTSFPINLDKRVLADMDTDTTVMKTPPRQLILVPQMELIKECLGYEGACGIVGMSDHQGYFSNAQIALSSNAHPNKWIKEKMSDYFIASELERYIGDLERDGELRDYTYRAKLMTGEKVELTVNARIVAWNGELARIVKTIYRRLID